MQPVSTVPYEKQVWYKSYNRVVSLGPGIMAGHPLTKYSDVIRGEEEPVMSHRKQKWVECHFVGGTQAASIETYTVQANLYFIHWECILLPF